MLIDHINNSFNRWEVAYRIGGHGGYSIIRSPEYGWVADPFLVEYKGDIYIFAEIFLWKSERNGIIGYCKYNGRSFGEWVVSMDRHWHLSYPFVFTKDDNLFMIPESYQLGEVAVYQLIQFPDKWEKVRTLISNVEYCDSTLFQYKNGKEYMFTFERGLKSPAGRGLLYDLDTKGLVNMRNLSDNLQGARCGGKVIIDHNRYIRVAQNCFPEYGKGLIFYEIDSIEPKYEEHEIYRMDVSDIQGDFNNNHIGIHTYNRLGEIEVIDLKYVVQSEEEKIASDRVREVFLNKFR